MRSSYLKSIYPIIIDGNSFITLHNIIHPRATTEFIYRYDDPDKAEVFLSFRMETTSRSTEVVAVLAELEKKGMKGVDISDNELAKTHARYLIGGRAKVPNERLFRFGACESLLELVGLLDLSILPSMQNFRRDLVPYENSCWVCQQVGISPCSTIAIMARVSSPPSSPTRILCSWLLRPREGARRHPGPSE